MQHGVDSEPARDPLIRERGVDVPVADNVGAPLEGRTDHLLDVLGARRREERGLRPGAHHRAVEDECAYSFTELRAARLAGQHDIATLTGQRRSEQLGLRRLTRAVGSLEGHEHEPPRYAARAREEQQHAGRTVMVRGARPAFRSSVPVARSSLRSRCRRARRAHRTACARGRPRRHPQAPPPRRSSTRFGRALASRSSSSTATVSPAPPGRRQRSCSRAAIATRRRATRRRRTRSRSPSSGRAGSGRLSASRATWESAL